MALSVSLHMSKHISLWATFPFPFLNLISINVLWFVTSKPITMGIKNLISYLTNSGLIKDHNLQNTSVVIDGDNIYRQFCLFIDVFLHFCFAFIRFIRDLLKKKVIFRIKCKQIFIQIFNYRLNKVKIILLLMLRLVKRVVNYGKINVSIHCMND